MEVTVESDLNNQPKRRKERNSLLIRDIERFNIQSRLCDSNKKAIENVVEVAKINPFEIGESEVYAGIVKSEILSVVRTCWWWRRIAYRRVIDIQNGGSDGGGGGNWRSIPSILQARKEKVLPLLSSSFRLKKCILKTKSNWRKRMWSGCMKMWYVAEDIFFFFWEIRILSVGA